MWDTLCCVTGALEVSMRHKSTTNASSATHKKITIHTAQRNSCNLSERTHILVTLGDWVLAKWSRRGRQGRGWRSGPNQVINTQLNLILTNVCYLILCWNHYCMKPVTTVWSTLCAKKNLGHSFAFTSFWLFLLFCTLTLTVTGHFITRCVIGQSIL